MIIDQYWTLFGGEKKWKKFIFLILVWYIFFSCTHFNCYVKFGSHPNFATKMQKTFIWNILLIYYTENTNEFWSFICAWKNPKRVLNINNFSIVILPSSVRTSGRSLDFRHLNHTLKSRKVLKYHSPCMAINIIM